MMRWASPLLRTILLMNLCAVLLLVAASNWPLPGQGSRNLPDTETLFIEDEVGAQAQDVSGILERPLFHENRQKTLPKKVAQQAAPIKRDVEPPFNLVGVLGSRTGGRTAYLFNRNSQETLSVKVDQLAGDWRVVQIEAAFIVLEAGGMQRKLDMQN